VVVKTKTLGFGSGARTDEAQVGAGSEISAEVVSQLNRALSVTPLMHIVQSSDGGGTNDGYDAEVGNNTRMSAVLFSAPEDCFVTAIRLCICGDIEFSATPGLPSAMCLLKVPLPWIDAAGNSQVLQVDGSDNPGGVSAHGDVAAVALGASPVATYSLEFISDNSPFIADNNAVNHQIFDLFDIPAAGTIAAGYLTDTLIAEDHALTNAQSLNPAGISLVRGDVLTWGVYNRCGAEIRVQYSIAYRPVKDELVLDPNISQSVISTSVDNRSR